MKEKTLLCPFDKEPCIMERCAAWHETRKRCSFSLLPDLLKTGQHEPVRPVKTGEEPSGSGKFRTLLFD